MALYIRALSNSDREHITQGRLSTNGTWSGRCRMLWASASRTPVVDIARGGGWHPESVRRILRRFSAGGLEALRPGKRAGRPPWEASLPEQTVDALLKLARESPEQHDVDLPVWTSDALAEPTCKQGVLEGRGSAKRIRNWSARRDTRGSSCRRDSRRFQTRQRGKAR